MEVEEHAAGTVTHFVVQAYRKGKRGKIEAEEPKVARDENNALAMAERLALSRHAVIAFSRTGDKETGDFDDPVILAMHGAVPDYLG
ncbi:MAG: hypothetical protein ABS76_15640 [Pelagibacterium sp. SCN 64-44]|nr:MAG: hypothetical protein ABS76_15640 [Pelagibacterium sp. SCN 64-44]